jgi:hypothetical protein
LRTSPYKSYRYGCTLLPRYPFVSLWPETRSSFGFLKVFSPSRSPVTSTAVRLKGSL